MKEIHIATDIYDNFHQSKQHYNAEQIQSLMSYCRSLGATTTEWIFDEVWSLYDNYPGGMDLLRTAIEAAHEQGMKFNVVYKPFEGTLGGMKLLPQTAPQPEGAVVYKDLRGLLPVVRPFIATHPEMCLKRRPGDEDPGGAVHSIRLIKNEDIPTGLQPEDLSIWISDFNGRFTHYEGSFTLQETSEWRPLFPLGQTCRVLTLSGLNIPQEQRYVEVRLADGALANEPFCNDYEQLMELINADGAVIPCTPAPADAPGQSFARQLARPFMSQLVRYAQHPEVRAFLADKDAVDKQAGEMRAYGRAVSGQEYSLGDEGYFSVARGKITYMCGVLNPIYPEVREHWLDVVRFCIERGADGVDFRTSHHGRWQENWAYGYNEPVLETTGGSLNVADVQRVIGDAYTQFLREARDLLHAHDRKIGVHLFPSLIRPDDERSGDAHDHMGYQWETWISEIADFAVFRGAMGLREDFLHYVVDRYGAACRDAKIPFIYQSNRRSFSVRPEPLRLHPDRQRWLEREMEYAFNHEGITAFQLYESSNLTHLDDDGVLQGNTEMRELISRSRFADNFQHS